LVALRLLFIRDKKETAGVFVRFRAPLQRSSRIGQ
jgi:hypothetical protein